MSVEYPILSRNGIDQTPVMAAAHTQMGMASREEPLRLTTNREATTSTITVRTWERAVRAKTSAAHGPRWGSPLTVRTSNPR